MSPENCGVVPPKVNLELWDLLSSWQRKSYIKFMPIQKSLVRTMITSSSILSEIYSGNFKYAKFTMLGQASNEVFKRSVINSEYKDLCSRNQPVSEFLLGHNLPQVVKELDLTNKLGSRPKNKYSYFRNKSHGNKGHHKQSSSLGRG